MAVEAGGRQVRLAAATPQARDKNVRAYCAERWSARIGGRPLFERYVRETRQAYRGTRNYDAYCGRRRVGFVLMGGPVIELLYVFPRHRRRGYGTAIVRELQRTRRRLEALPNAFSEPIFRRLGFREWSEHGLCWSRE